MSTIRISPAKRIRGEVQLPGDKSIAHRIALIAAISDGTTEASNFPDGADCLSTVSCLEQLGVGVRVNGSQLHVEGRGLGGLTAPLDPLDAGNSGTTVRLLSGILAGQSFSATIRGDWSLSRRPMGRIVEPLERFGAQIQTSNGGLPMTIHGGPLKAIRYDLPVPSAQVKSAVLLAGSQADGTTSVHENVQTRNHTEIALLASGARIRLDGQRIEIDGGSRLHGRSLRIPGDLSSAAFLLAAALMLPDSRLRLIGVGVNSTRSSYLALLQGWGAQIGLDSLASDGGEATANILATSSHLCAIDLPPLAIPTLIDELPILAVLGAASNGIQIRGAAELRVKESDRIHALVMNLGSIGIEVEEFEDGLKVAGGQKIEGGRVSSYGDHRIAMAFAVAGLVSRHGVEIDDPECVGISFPGFFPLLDSLVET